MRNDDSRHAWPFAGLLPNRLYHYPVPSLMPSVGPRRPEEWPPRAPRSFRAWADRTSRLPTGEHLLYVHVPLCPFICDFCPFYKESGRQKADAYVEGLLREIALAARIDALRAQRFGAIYFGGGTPTELDAAHIAQILDALRRHFDVDTDAEVTLEGVARQLLRPGYLEACVSFGVNRISFGVQSLDAVVRQEIGRSGDSVDDYPAAVARVRAVDPRVTINVELMMGCPRQTAASLDRDLREVVAWAPDSLDVYSFIPAVGTRFYRQLVQKRRDEPGCGASLLNMRRHVVATLSDSGYQLARAEVFIKSDRHWFAPTSPARIGNALSTILALGPSAIGHIDGTAYRNVCNLDHYLAIVGSGRLPIERATTMSARTARRRGLITAIGDLYVPHLLMGAAHRRMFRAWERRGLVTRAADGYALTSDGALWENEMQLALLTTADLVKMLPMMGSVEEQEMLLRSDSGLAREVLAQVRAGGGVAGAVRELGYRAALKVLKYAPFVDRRGVGYLGTTG